MLNTTIIIKKEKQIDKLIGYCKKTGYASVDFETNGRPFHHPDFIITTMAISFQPGISYVLPLGHKESKFKSRWKRLYRKFGKAIFEDKDIIKVAYNFKFEMLVSRTLGVEFRGRIFDAMLAKYLLKEERPNDLKSVVAQFIPYYAGYDLKGQPGKDATQENIVNFWSNVPLPELCKYNGLDSDLTLRLMMFFENLLIKNNFYKLFRNMMMMAVRVLHDSEWHGMPIDIPYIDTLLISYKTKIEDADKFLRSNSLISRFENKMIKDRITKYIISIEEEIEEIESELNALKKRFKKTQDNGLVKKINSAKKKIETRNNKISSLIARDLTTQKELKLLEPINFNSPAQLIELFFRSKYGFRFDIVKYTTDPKTKKDTKNPSTDEEVLLELKGKDKSGFIDSLLNYRSLTKLYSTYVLGMNNKISTQGNIHGSFLLHGTVTGRLSSREPNLQNIPRDTTASDIKKMFIPPKGKILLQLDYSQAELRVMAAQANETEMLKWFREGRDIHLAVACDKNKWDYDWALKILKKEDKNDPNFTSVKTERKYAKTINFGIIYGQTARKLSEGMETSIEEAQIYLEEYAKRFPNVWKFIQKQHKYLKNHGYVYNLFGRKRRLPNVFLPMKTEADRKANWGKVAEAQRQSVNAPIQGAASDFTLFSSILIWEKIKRGELPKDLIQVYTVHDSLGFFLDPADLKKVVPVLEKICSNPETKEWFGFQIDSVKMQVDFEVSEKSWGDLSTYHPKTDYVQLVEAA
jgi:DNA polymerase I-like protein with 3'-5' exonuclease and polymerase domains